MIGINDYPAPIPKLGTAVGDAKAVGKLLTDKYGFEVKLLLDGDATRGHILEALSGYETSLSDADSLLIYYAGHGFDNKVANQTYWLPVDANSPRSANRISANDLTTEFATLPVRHILVISDSCYSGGLTRDINDRAESANSGEAFLRKMLDGRSRNLMASGRDEPVADGGPDNHSVFAAAVLKALQSETRPMFSASDMFYNAVQRLVAGNAQQVPQYATIHNSGDEFGDFVFRLANVSVAEVSKSLTAPAPGYNEAGTLFEAKKYFEAARMLAPLCDSKDWRSCALLGMMFEKGYGLATDLPQAASLYQKSCEAGLPSSCLRLGNAYVGGRGLPTDQQKGELLYGRACDTGEAEACSRLGLLYGGVNRTKAENAQAVVLFKKACESGDSDGCAALGKKIETDKDSPTALTQAADFYRSACKRGSYVSCVSLGHFLEDGTGIHPDIVQAAQLYRKACEGDDPSGCLQLAKLYLEGSGVTKNTQQASIFLEKSCNLSVKDRGLSCFVAAQRLRGIDPARSVPLFVRMCDEGHPPACVFAGKQYDEGQGVTVDRTRALEYFAKSCSLPVQARNACGIIVLISPRHAQMAVHALQETLAATLHAGIYTPAEAGLRSTLLEAYAFVLSQLNRGSEAITALRESIQLEPTYSRFYNLSANLATDGKLLEALQAAQEGSKLFPKDLGLRRRQADLLIALGRAPEAIALCSATSTRRTEDAEGFVCLTNAYLSATDIRTAGQTMQKAEAFATTPALRDEIGSEFNGVGYRLADDGKKLDEAVVLIKEALKFSPDNGTYLDSLGWAYFKQGNDEEAEKTLLRAVTLTPDEGSIWDHLGDIYAKEGKRGLALQAWEKAIINPENDLVYEKVKLKINSFKEKRKS